MTVSNPLMIVIGAYMLYRTIAGRKRMPIGVFLFWVVLFGAVIIVAALVTFGLLPSSI